MAAHHYKSNLRDIEFNLFELLQIQETTLGKGEFSSMDEATARETLRGVQRISEDELAASFVIGDREGLNFDGEGNVTLPEIVKKSLQSWYDAQWHLLEVPERLGGFGAPPSVCWASWEMVSGANPGAAFYQFGTFMARVIDHLATDEQKARYVRNMLDKCWGATMVLTEPDAGSDVGVGRSKAKHIEGDVWELEGTKRFITNGDYDLPENIVHMVLARPEGAGPGTKGLSLFIVPKFWVNEDGSLGERNGVYVTGVEHKMGIKISATCELTLGEKHPCRGLLVGNVHDGIRQMFKVIEQARMSIGVKTYSTMSTAYLNALCYAKDRVQGPDLTKAMDKSSPRVRIIQHPDVRRMLMQIKSHTEAMRALVLYTAVLQDKVELAGGHQASDAHHLSARSDLLLPLIKGYFSHRGFELLAQALQIFGGAGYTMDLPMEQYIRDQKIDTLYEGTTHIQALDLFFRKIARDGGETLRLMLEEVAETANSDAGGEGLADEKRALLKALGDMQGIFGAMMGKAQESVYHVGLHGNRILYALSETLLAWMLVRQAALATEKLSGANEADRPFYRGKLAACRFFCRDVLPGVTASRKVIEGSELSLMELDEAAF
jgi:alkylation response protein AidB-like acyl-CoA dehydrogenase